MLAVEVRLGQRPAELSVLSLAKVELGGERMTAQVVADFRATGASLFSLHGDLSTQGQGDLSTQWQIDSIESVKAFECFVCPSKSVQQATMSPFQCTTIWSYGAGQ